LKLCHETRFVALRRVGRGRREPEGLDNLRKLIRQHDVRPAIIEALLELHSNIRRHDAQRVLRQLRFPLLIYIAVHLSIHKFHLLPDCLLRRYSSPNN
jgi:hypothetical protein